jgi:uncharacterized protein HemX
MRFKRAILLLVVLGAVGAAMAIIRIEQTRCVARIQKLKLRQIELKRTLDAQQMELARLRDPSRILDRVDDTGFELDLSGPAKMAMVQP